MALQRGAAPCHLRIWRTRKPGCVRLSFPCATPAGEGESTCLVRRPDWQRVLRICDVGHLCTIRGVIHECADIPIECSEVKQIFSIRR